MQESGPTRSGPDAGEDFEEAQVVRQMLRRRHLVLVGTLTLAGVMLVSLGALLVWWDVSPVVGGFCTVFGGLSLVRGALSAFTDIDTRDRKDFEKMQERLAAETARKLGEARP